MNANMTGFGWVTNIFAPLDENCLSIEWVKNSHDDLYGHTCDLLRYSAPAQSFLPYNNCNIIFYSDNHWNIGTNESLIHPGEL